MMKFPLAFLLVVFVVEAVSAESSLSRVGRLARGGNEHRRGLSSSKSAKSKSSCKSSKGDSKSKGSSSKSRRQLSKSSSKGSSSKGSKCSESKGSKGSSKGESAGTKGAAAASEMGCAHALDQSNSAQVQIVFELVSGNANDAQLRGDYVNAIVEGTMVQDLADPVDCGRRRLQRRKLQQQGTGIRGFQADGISPLNAACSELTPSAGQDCYRMQSILDYYVDPAADIDEAGDRVVAGVPKAFENLPSQDVKLISVKKFGTVSYAQSEQSSQRSVPAVGVAFIVIAAVAVLVLGVLFVRRQGKRRERLLREIDYITKQVEVETDADSVDLAHIYGEETTTVAHSVQRMSRFKCIPAETEPIVSESYEVSESGVVTSKKSKRTSRDESPWFVHISDHYDR